MVIDLHSHTTASDGVLEPPQLIDAAAAAGIDVLAITDHDTVAGLEDAIAAADTSPLELLCGIEISAFRGDTEIHILGLGLQLDTPGLTDWLDRLIISREERFHHMIERLADMGMPVEIGDLLDDRRGSIGRPHIARLMVEAGHAASIDDAFDRFLNKGQPVYVERFRLDCAEAISKVHEAGGCAVQAHPGAMGNDRDIPALVELGLDGIEAHHPDHQADRRAHYASMAAELGVLATGGSDFHGDDAGRATRLGQRTTPPEQFEALQDRWTRYR